MLHCGDIFEPNTDTDKSGTASSNCKWLRITAHQLIYIKWACDGNFDNLHWTWLDELRLGFTMLLTHLLGVIVFRRNEYIK